MRSVYSVDDPTVVALGRFLQSAPLSNGTTTSGLGSDIAVLLAQAVCNWTRGLVFSDGQWIERSTFESLPDVGDVEIESLADGQVVKMTHRATGITSLGESHEQAWQELRAKVVAERANVGDRGRI